MMKINITTLPFCHSGAVLVYCVVCSMMVIDMDFILAQEKIVLDSPQIETSKVFIPLEPISFEADLIRMGALKKINFPTEVTPELLKMAPKNICNILNVDLGSDMVVPGWRNKIPLKDFRSITGWNLIHNTEDALTQELEFTSSENEIMEVKLTYLPSTLDTRLQWLAPDLKCIGAVCPMSIISCGIRRLKKGPGDICLASGYWRKIAPDGSASEVFHYYWDESKLLFFRNNCYVEIKYPRNNIPQGSNPYTYQDDRDQNIMDFAEQLDAFIINLHARDDSR